MNARMREHLVLRLERSTDNLEKLCAKYVDPASSHDHLSPTKYGFLPIVTIDNENSANDFAISFSLDQRARTYAVDTGAIRFRADRGQTIENRPALYVRRLKTDSNAAHVQVETTNYHSIASSVMRLETEHVTDRRRLRQWGYRNEYFSLEAVRCGEFNRPSLFGCAVAMLFARKDGQWDLLIHKRAASTFTYQGQYALTPNFGFAPIPTHTPSGSRFVFEVIPDRLGERESFITYNLYKEFLEELFGYDELDDTNLPNHVDPYWIYNTPEALELQRLCECQELRFHLLGYGIDLTTMGHVLGLAAVFSRPLREYSLFANIKANWEVETDASGPHYRWITVGSPEYESFIRGSLTHSAAAHFAEVAGRFVTNTRRNQR